MPDPIHRARVRARLRTQASSAGSLRAARSIRPGAFGLPARAGRCDSVLRRALSHALFPREFRCRICRRGRHSRGCSGLQTSVARSSGSKSSPLPSVRSRPASELQAAGDAILLVVGFSPVHLINDHMSTILGPRPSECTRAARGCRLQACAASGTMPGRCAREWPLEPVVLAGPLPYADQSRLAGGV